MSAAHDLGLPTVLRTGTIDASPPAGSRRTGPGFDASTLLLGLSLLLVWGLLYLLVLSGLQQSRSQAALYQELRSDLAAGTAPIAAPIPQGDPVALISIPDAGLEDSVVVEGTRPAQLQLGPGHRLGSVLPGQVGNATIAGKSLTFGAPFKGVEDLVRGSRIVVTTGQGEFTFLVAGTRRDGDPIPTEVANATAKLTLLTASRGAASASETVYVDAILSGTPVAPTTRSAPDPDARPMSTGTDVTTLALLALSLQLLVATLAAFAWAWHRWSHRGAWIAVTPCVLGALWLTSSLGTRLLPGLV